MPGKSEGWRMIYKTVLQIKLQWVWLEELGFALGTEMHIECSDGQLIITKADEVILNNSQSIIDYKIWRSQNIK